MPKGWPATPVLMQLLPHLNERTCIFTCSNFNMNESQITCMERNTKFWAVRWFLLTTVFGKSSDSSRMRDSTIRNYTTSILLSAIFQLLIPGCCGVSRSLLAFRSASHIGLPLMYAASLGRVWLRRSISCTPSVSTERQC